MVKICSFMSKSSRKWAVSFCSTPLCFTSSTSGLVWAVVLQQHRVSRLPPAPGGLREGLRLRQWSCRGEWWRSGVWEQGGKAHGKRRRGRGAGVRDGSLVAVAPLEGPGAALHLAQAADGVEDDRGSVDGQLRKVQVGSYLAVQAGPNPVLQVGREGSRLGNQI